MVPIEDVMAQMVDNLTGLGNSTMAVAVRFSSGAVGSLVGSYDSSYAYPNTHYLEVNGTHGSDIGRGYGSSLRVEQGGRRALHCVGSGLLQ